MSTFNFSKAEAGHGKHTRDSDEIKRNKNGSQHTCFFHGPPASSSSNQAQFPFFVFFWQHAQFSLGVPNGPGRPGEIRKPVFSPTHARFRFRTPAAVAAGDSTPPTNLLPSPNTQGPFSPKIFCALQQF